MRECGRNDEIGGKFGVFGFMGGIEWGMEMVRVNGVWIWRCGYMGMV